MNPALRLKRLFESAVKAFGRTDAGRWYVRNISLRVDPTLLSLTGGRVSSVYPTARHVAAPPPAPRPACGARCRWCICPTTPGSSWWRRTSAASTTQGGITTSSPTRMSKCWPVIDSGSYVAAEITNLTGRERTWALVLGMNAGYDVYVARAGQRTIPLIRLRRGSSGSGSGAGASSGTGAGVVVSATVSTGTVNSRCHGLAPASVRNASTMAAVSSASSGGCQSQHNRRRVSGVNRFSLGHRKPLRQLGQARCGQLPAVRPPRACVGPTGTAGGGPVCGSDDVGRSSAVRALASASSHTCALRR